MLTVRAEIDKLPQLSVRSRLSDDFHLQGVCIPAGSQLLRITPLKGGAKGPNFLEKGLRSAALLFEKVFWDAGWLV